MTVHQVFFQIASRTLVVCEIESHISAYWVIVPLCPNFLWDSNLEIGVSSRGFPMIRMHPKKKCTIIILTMNALRDNLMEALSGDLS